MKKLLLIAILAILTAPAANAQWFVGGSFALEFGSTKPDGGGDKDKTHYFSLSPEIGYQFNDIWAGGGGVIFGTGKTTNISDRVPFDSDDLPFGDNTKVDLTVWGIAPFVRASVINWKKWEVMLQGTFSIMGGDMEKSEGSSTKYDLVSVGLNVTPMIAYNVSPKIQLQASLKCFSFGYNYVNVKDMAKVSDFEIGLDSDNLLNTNNIEIGFIVRF